MLHLTLALILLTTPRPELRVPYVEVRAGAAAVIYAPAPSVTLERSLRVTRDSSLHAGDLVCGDKGQVTLRYSWAGRVQVRPLRAGDCVQVPVRVSAAKNLLAQLTEAVQQWYRGSPPVVVTGGSRGPEASRCRPPLLLPEPFHPAALLLPVSGDAARTLRLLNSQGTVTYTSQVRGTDATFRIPAARLMNVSRLEVWRADGTLLYGTPVVRVGSLTIPPAGQEETLDRLLTTPLPEFAPALLSYLALDTGREAEARAVDQLIRQHWQGEACRFP
ncbi:hypothetical protein [Deinococcus sp. NW-56]|uniref:hypothetical protein n=1 Tax=Deinococcus sp. NW-56 TaxID=2080419 RepID=UPI00131A1B12|nr:hypothetical protein [Deinococcus sp. NW-56]